MSTEIVRECLSLGIIIIIQININSQCITLCIRHIHDKLITICHINGEFFFSRECLQAGEHPVAICLILYFDQFRVCKCYFSNILNRELFGLTLCIETKFLCEIAQTNVASSGDGECMISVIEINSIQNRIDRESLRFKLDLVYFVIVIGLNFYRYRLVLLLIEVNSLHFGLLLDLDRFLVRDIDFYSALRLNFLVTNHDLDVEEARVRYAVLYCSICFLQISLVLLQLFIFLDLCDLQLCVSRNLGICIITKSDTIVLTIVITVKFQFACRISRFCCGLCAAS